MEELLQWLRANAALFQAEPNHYTVDHIAELARIIGFSTSAISQWCAAMILKRQDLDCIRRVCRSCDVHIPDHDIVCKGHEYALNMWLERGRGLLSRMKETE